MGEREGDGERERESFIPSESLSIRQKASRNWTIWSSANVSAMDEPSNIKMEELPVCRSD